MPFVPSLLISISFLGQDASFPVQIQSLIQEVRSLRATLDRTTFVGLRVQLVLHRLGQQQNVLALAADTLQRQERYLASLKNEPERLRAELARMEKQTHEPAEWSRLRIDAIKKSLETHAETNHLAIQKHIEAEQTYRAERQKLEDLQRQLDDLEKQLAQIGK